MDSACAGNDVLAILADRYPNLSFLLQFTDFDPHPLHAEFIFKRNLHAVEVFYLYGIGPHFLTLKPWLEEKKDRVLIILEENLGAIHACLQEEYAEELLAHPQVHIRFAPTLKELRAEMHECVLHFPSEYVEFAAIEAYRVKKRFRTLQMELYRATAVSHALLTEACFPHKLHQNLISNILKWPGSFFANRLKNQFKGIPAIICGAGPSLAKTYEQLKNVGDRALIIAGGSTIAALSNHGIIPHIGLAFDPNAEEFDRLKAASSYEMPLIYGSRLEARVFNTCNGPRGYILSDTGGPLETHFEKTLNLEEPAVGPDLGVEAFSVTTLCIALAVEMGCDPIILNGIDLAYTEKRRYAAGVLPSSDPLHVAEAQALKKASERLVTRKDIFGNRVHTLVKWIMESQCIGAYAKKNSQTRFFNATPGGLGFPHIANHPLQEILDAHCQRTTDLHALLHTHFYNAHMPAIPSTIDTEMQAIAESLARLETINEQILTEIQRVKQHNAALWPSGLMTLLECDFQEEKAYNCLFPVLGIALDRLFNRAHYLSPLIPEDRKREILLERALAKWTRFKEIIQSEKELFEQASYLFHKRCLESVHFPELY